MKVKNFVFALSLAVFVLAAMSFASATVDFVNVAGATQTLNPGTSTASISFNVQATTFSGQIDNAVIVLPNDIFGASASWSGSNTPFTLLPDSNSSLKSFTLAVPAFQMAGSYPGVISLTGTYNETGGLPVIHTLPITITVNSVPSLSITSTRYLDRTNTGIITVSNTGNTDELVNLTLSGDINASLSTYNFPLAKNTISQQIIVSPLMNLNNSALSLGTHSVSIVATDLNSGVNSSSPAVYYVNGDFCKFGNVNVSQISIDSVREWSTSSTSSDSWKWKPLDNVTVDVKIINNFDSDQDFIIALGLYDTTKNKLVELTSDSSSDSTNNVLEDSISIDSSHSGTLTFNFKVPVDLVDSDGRYVMYVKAYRDSKEASYCTSNSVQGIDPSVNELQLKRISHEVIISDITAPVIVSAGESVKINTNIVNIGTSDEDKVKAILTNTKLGLSVETNPFTLNSEDTGNTDFVFNIPSDAQDGTYDFNIGTYYNYKNGDYRTLSSTAWTATIKVVGGKPAVNQTVAATISASLQSEAKAGSEMTVKSTITNTASGLITFKISAREYSSWATLSSISDQTITLGAGQSKDVTFKFNVLGSASGEQSFFIDATNGANTASKEFAVNLASSSIFAQLKNSLGNNSMIWIIGLVNLVLIILIIVVVVRVVRR